MEKIHTDEDGKTYIIHKSAEVDSGVVWMPFVMVESDGKPDDVYENFMKEYRLKHAVCKICGSKEYNTTLVGYMFDRTKPEEYKDNNRCTCMKCGNVSSHHERISVEEFENKSKI